jgi:hypothetical protein
MDRKAQEIIISMYENLRRYTIHTLKSLLYMYVRPGAGVGGEGVEKISPSQFLSLPITSIEGLEER